MSEHKYKTNEQLIKYIKECEKEIWLTKYNKGYYCECLACDMFYEMSKVLEKYHVSPKTEKMLNLKKFHEKNCKKEYE